MSKPIPPELAAELALFFKRFPIKITKNEANYTGLSYKGLPEVTLSYESGAPVWELKSSANTAPTIPSAIDSALKATSFSHYLKTLITHRDRNSRIYPRDDKVFLNHFDGFDPTPLIELSKPPKKLNRAHLEAYLRRRLVFSFTKICALNPKMFFKKKLFIDWLRETPEKKNSNFLRAIKIEPCILQTRLGLELLGHFSFWDRENTQNLSIALKTSNEDQKSGKLSSDYIKTRLIQTLLLVETFHPKIFRLRDEQLQTALVKYGVLYRPTEPAYFGKIRREIHRKQKK